MSRKFTIYTFRVALTAFQVCKSHATVPLARSYTATARKESSNPHTLNSFIARLAVSTKRLQSSLSIFPMALPLSLPLSIPSQLWASSLSNPRLMNPIALAAGLPRLLSSANTFTRGTYSYVTKATLSRSPQLPTLRQIDARLRRSMDTALHSCAASALPARLVIINALSMCGRQIPYMLGVILADAIQRTQGHCMQPVMSPQLEQDVQCFSEHPDWLHWATAIAQELRRNLTTIMHVLRLVVLFTPLALSAPLTFYLGGSRRAWMESLRETLEAAGPAFIKWGQWAATRQDMFPPEMCEQLAMLQCNAPCHPWSFTKRTLEESFGMPLEVLVEWIDHEPLASGSIGQVHRAALSQRGADVCGMPRGKVVAIKVKHPNVSTSIQRDFGIMMWAAGQLEWIPQMRKMRLQESLQQFATPLREQVDLALEANNLWRFNKNFSKDKLVSLPVPLYPWVSQDVLMESFEEGMHISTYMERDCDIGRRGAVAGVGSHCMLTMMLVHHFIHSDLHPGNILVRWQLPDGWLIDAAARVMQWFSTSPPEKMFESWMRPHVVLLDVGMATELSARDRHHMLHLFKSFIELDGPTMAEHTLDFAGDMQRCIDREGFKLAIGRKMDEFRVESWAESQYNSSAAAFAAILDVVREFEVTMPGHICAVLVTVLVLEGWSSQLSPDRSVLEEVKSVVAMDERSWRVRMSQLVDQWIDWAPVLPSLDTV